MQEKLEAAREYIKLKQYDKARAILEKIEHPTADKWLKQLNERDTDYQLAVRQRRYARQAAIAVIVFLLVLGAGCGLYYTFVLRPSFNVILTNVALTSIAR